MHCSSRMPVCLVGLLVLCFTFFSLPGRAKALTVINETERLVVCTVRDDVAFRPLAQFFVYPGKSYDWMPRSLQEKEWRISVVAEDNGMHSNNQPVVVYPSSISNTLYVHPGVNKAEIEVMESSAPTANVHVSQKKDS